MQNESDDDIYFKTVYWCVFQWNWNLYIFFLTFYFTGGNWTISGNSIVFKSTVFSPHILVLEHFSFLLNTTVMATLLKLGHK